jgi:hypothetical protein
MAAGLETNSSWKNLDFEFMNCEEERERRETHIHTKRQRQRRVQIKER